MEGLLLFVVWFLPFIIALMRDHHNKTAIFLLTLLLTWTIIGWFVALIWSFTNKPTVVTISK